MGKAYALKAAFHDAADKKIAQLRVSKKWLATPPIAKILSSLEYLAEKYDAKLENYIDGSYVSVYMTLDKLTGLKDESLAALLYSMEHHNANDTSTSDVAASYSRTYCYRWNEYTEGGYVSLNVHIAANFKEDSETCKRVIVGYQEPSKEARPIYKLECVDPVPATETPATAQ